MDTFAALADPVRRSLVRQLAVEPGRVVDLAKVRDISRPAISRHLRLLSEAGLCTVQARGRERIYHLDRSGLTAVQEFLDAVTVAEPPLAETALDALELEVRRAVREVTTHPEEKTG